MQNRERLQYMRVLYNLTQQNVATYIGSSKQYITMLESGQRPMSQSQFEKILNAIYFLGEEKKKGRLKEVLEDIKNNNLLKE